jgi:hypothetical protein
MRKLTVGLLSLSLLALPGAARAGGLLAEFSLGSGYQLGLSSPERIPTSLGVAVGYGLTDMLKLELGAFANLGDVQNSIDNANASTFDMDLRAMVVVAPPLFPLYLRGIVGQSNVLNGPTKITYGGALGVSFGLFGIGGFVEAGAMQKTYSVTVPGAGTATQEGWQAEGKVGIKIG